MVKEAVLTRAADKVTWYIENYVTLMGVEKRDEVLELFDTLHRVFPHWVICTCPVMHPDLHFATVNCQHVFGYPYEFIINNSGVNKYFAFVHEADQEDLFGCFNFMHDFLKRCRRKIMHVIAPFFITGLRKPMDNLFTCTMKKQH